MPSRRAGLWPDSSGLGSRADERGLSGSIEAALERGPARIPVAEVQEEVMMHNGTTQLDATEVRIDGGTVSLTGDLAAPAGATGIVVFAHGSGSSRLSPRNRYVAGALNAAGFATLLFDLLTPAEEREDLHTARLRFDLDLLAGRLSAATDWLESQPWASGLALGYFGASTGAAAALMAAAWSPDRVGAVVSRGGRPDLAGALLERVRAPTLLIVGGLDYPVIDMNREALVLLGGVRRLEIVEGATHLFEESGALEGVARLAAGWFQQHLGVPSLAESRSR